MRPEYPRIAAVFLWLTLGLALDACTDWSAGTAGGPWLQATGGAGLADAVGADAGAAPGNGSGIVPWDTWKAPDASAPKSDGSGVDTAKVKDAEEISDGDDTAAGSDVAVVEILDPDGAIDDSAMGDATAGPDTADVPYSMDGKADFAGWPELPPPAPDVPPAEDSSDAMDAEQADAAPAETAEPDAAQPDAVGPDAADPDAPEPDIFAPDVVIPDDVGPDAIESDVSEQDAPPPDLQGPDEISWDATPDSSEPDLWAPDAGPVDTGGLDGAGPDIPVQDAMADVPPDISADTSADSSLPDGAQAPDWQGYPDLPYAADADVYGGAIGSCLSMYLYQQELCGDSNPTAACIDSMTADGSLFAQFQFDPLRKCETAVCTDLCALATTKQCMESCVAKYCAAPFLACTSNGAQGAQSCADAWKCSKQYPDKLLTISAKCYSAATAQGQQQFSAVIGCVSKPQTSGCIPEVSACFNAGAAATASCSSTLTCMKACNNDEICGFTCMGQASPAAVQLIDAIWTCSLNVCTPKCAASSDPACQDDCMKSECQSQLVQCLIN